MHHGKMSHDGSKICTYENTRSEIVTLSMYDPKSLVCLTTITTNKNWEKNTKND